MIFNETEIKDVYTIDLEKREDERGFFARAWCAREAAAYQLETAIVQMNISLSREKGTLRGMHYQMEPSEETKVVRCIRGAIFDVVIDMRPESPTYLKWVGVELTPENRRALYVPKKFAHGFLTLADDSEVMYFCSEYYNPQAERGVRFNDPAVNIQWPGEIMVVSEKDQRWPDIVPINPGIVIK